MTATTLTPRLQNSETYQKILHEADIADRAERDRKRKPLAEKLEKLEADFAKSFPPLADADHAAREEMLAAVHRCQSSPGDIDLRIEHLKAVKRYRATQAARHAADTAYQRERSALLFALEDLIDPQVPAAIAQLRQIRRGLITHRPVGLRTHSYSGRHTTIRTLVPDTGKKSKAEIRNGETRHYIRETAIPAAEALEFSPKSSAEIAKEIKAIFAAVPHLKLSFSD